MTTPRAAMPGFTRYAWVILLARASLALILGLVVLATGQFRPGMANIIAIYWLLGAVMTLRWAATHRDVRGYRLALAAGVVAVLASVAVLARDVLRGALADDIAWVLVGAMSLMVGMLRATGIFRESIAEDVRRARPEAVALGGLEIALGLVLVIRDLRGFAIPMVGIWGLVAGTVMARDAFRARRAARSRVAPT
jgi:uncharacterized membrane protein HdeD (DUF308 family)